MAISLLVRVPTITPIGPIATVAPGVAGDVGLAELLADQPAG